MRLAHIMIRVKNLETSIKFYRDIFKMQLFKRKRLINPI